MLDEVVLFLLKAFDSKLPKSSNEVLTTVYSGRDKQ